MLPACGAIITPAAFKASARLPAKPALNARLAERTAAARASGTPVGAVDTLIAATDNDAYNALVCSALAPEIGRGRVFQLPMGPGAEDDPKSMAIAHRGRIAFGEGAGFEIVDIGFNADPEKFVEAIKEHQPDVVGMSAMLTTTMRAMAQTIKAIEEAGLRDQVKIMVGGAPVDAAFAERIGADGYGANAPAGSDLAKKFVGAA